MKKTICTVVVTYNRLDILKQSLNRIRSQTLRPDDLVVVDNCSTDGTREYLNQMSGDDHFYCLLLNENIGYAGSLANGIIHAMKLHKYDFFWIMDDDTYYDETTLEKLCEHLQDSDFGILGLSGSDIRMGIKHKKHPTHITEEADYVLIDGALIKTMVIDKVGVPDVKYFMMCEDHEYCKRIKRAGFKVGILNLGIIERLHMGGAGRFTRNTLWRGYYQSRNHILIIKEYFTVPDLLGYMFTQTELLLAAALYAPDRFKRIQLRLIGIWHGIKGVSGKTLDPVTLKFNKRKSLA